MRVMAVKTDQGDPRVFRLVAETDDDYEFLSAWDTYAAGGFMKQTNKTLGPARGIPGAREICALDVRVA